MKQNQEVREYSITCPHCSLKNDLHLQTVIDLAEMPEYRKKILQDELNRFVCTTCLYSCELYFDFAVINSLSKYKILFSRNKTYLSKWKGKVIETEYETDYDSSRDYLKCPVAISNWKELKDAIESNERLSVPTSYFKLFDNLAEQDPMELYYYVSNNQHLLWHSNVVFHILRLFEKHKVFDLFRRKILSDIENMSKEHEPKEALTMIFKYLGEKNDKVAKLSHYMYDSRPDENQSVESDLPGDSEADAIVLISGTDPAKCENPSKDFERRSELIQSFVVLSGRSFSDISFVMINSREDLHHPDEIDSGNYFYVSEEAFEFVSHIFGNAFDEKPFEIYLDHYFEPRDLEYIIEELVIFRTSMDFFNDREVFYAVCSNILGKSGADNLFETHYDCIDDVRMGIRIMCEQYETYLRNCLESNKLLVHLGL